MAVLETSANITGYKGLLSLASRHRLYFLSLHCHAKWPAVVVGVRGLPKMPYEFHSCH